jgi:hypothetical protein
MNCTYCQVRQNAVQAFEESDHAVHAKEVRIAEAGIQNPEARIASCAVGKEGDPAGHVGHRSCRRPTAR